MWILEKNFRNKVLYVESLNGNARLNYEKVRDISNRGAYSAISSHLISRPSVEVSPQPLTITFLRNPSARLVSAYEFQKATNSLKEGDKNFRAFLTRLRQSPVSNYQARLLSPQSWESTGPRSGWDLNPRAINLEDENLFVGTVELFDESMILLEEWLEERGLHFDSSYSKVSNAGIKEKESSSMDLKKMVFPDMIEVDNWLWNEVSNNLQLKIKNDSKFDSKLEKFKDRRRAISQLEIPMIGPDEFVRI